MVSTSQFSVLGQAADRQIPLLPLLLLLLLADGQPGATGPRLAESEPAGQSWGAILALPSTETLVLEREEDAGCQSGGVSGRPGA